MTLAEELADSTVENYANEETDPEEWDLEALTERGDARSSASTPPKRTRSTSPG